MVWVSQVLGAVEVTSCHSCHSVPGEPGVPWPGLSLEPDSPVSTKTEQRLGMQWGMGWKDVIFFKANLKQQAEKQKNPPKDSRNKPSFIFETFFNVDWHDHRKLNQRPYSDGACYSPLGLPVAGPRHRAPLPLKCHAETNVTRPTASWETAQFGSLNLTEFSRTSGVERSKKHETPEFL